MGRLEHGTPATLVVVVCSGCQSNKFVLASIW
jgi:hypothetical protein